MTGVLVPLAAGALFGFAVGVGVGRSRRGRLAFVADFLGEEVEAVHRADFDEDVAAYRAARISGEYTVLPPVEVEAFMADSQRCPTCKGTEVVPVTGNGSDGFDRCPDCVPSAEVVHRCPYPGTGVTPCCGRTPFELPLTDRLTLSHEDTTCPAWAEGDVSEVRSLPKGRWH